MVSEVWESSTRSPQLHQEPQIALIHPHSHLLSVLILDLSMGALGSCLSSTAVIPVLVLCAAVADILTRVRGLAMNLSHYLAIVCSRWAAYRPSYSAGRSQSLPML